MVACDGHKQMQGMSIGDTRVMMMMMKMSEVRKMTQVNDGSTFEGLELRDILIGTYNGEVSRVTSR